jgi:uncharacterized protein YlbG (UPF0298 family)
MRKLYLITAFTLLVFATTKAQNLTKSALCKKWYLHHYEYLWKKYEPETKEKNDYIYFSSDMTYISVDEGKKTTGKWSFNAKEKYILMYNEKEEKIKLEVEELNADKFVFEIDHSEMKGLEIHYSSVKK